MWADIDKVVYQIPKDAQEDFMYASSVSIEGFNIKHQKTATYTSTCTIDCTTVYR